MATTKRTGGRKRATGKGGTTRSARRSTGGSAAGGRSSSPKKASTKSSSATRAAAKSSNAKKGTAKATGARKSGNRSVRATRNSLALYNAKRDFSRTAEPAGRQATAASRLRFVVQKHAASHLHFDFRLELDGVMKSWAVPKGPSYDPSVKRLAMEVEDHPIEYNRFEGTIPKGEYGGGTVMIWDRGTYAPESGDVDDLREGYRRGDLKFVMHGERMQGSWVLVRTRRDRGRNQWLLIKHRDEFATPGADIVAAVQTSVVTGRTMEQIAKGRRVWHSNRERSG